MWNRIFKSKSKENRTKKTKLSKHLSFGSSASKIADNGMDDVSPTSPSGGSETEGTDACWFPFFFSIRLFGFRWVEVRCIQPRKKKNRERNN